MAIALGNGGYTVAIQANGTSPTISVDCSGSNVVLFACFGLNETGNGVTSVTYNGVSMTQLAVDHDVINDRYQYIYYLINPSTGANNLVINKSGSGFVVGAAAPYTGVDQSAPIDITGVNYKSTSNTTETQSITTTIDNDWIIRFIRNLDGASLNAFTGCTIKGSGSGTYFAQYGPKTPAGTVTFGASDSANSRSLGRMVSFQPVVTFGTAPTLQRTRYRDALGTVGQAKRYRKRELLGQIDSVGAVI